MFMRLTIMVLILLAEMIGGGTAYGWYNSGWLYRQQITIQSNKVSGALTNFPVLITESNVNAGIWQHAQSNGLDLVIVRQDDTTRLAHEVEWFNTNAQQMAVWVKLPVLSAETNLTFYIYYGSVVTNGLQDPYNLWTNYNVVLHLGEAPVTNYDSTTNLNHGYPQPTYSTVTGDISISTCESTNDWTWTGDTLALNTTKKEGTYSISAAIATVVTGQTYTLTYDPPGTLNLAGHTLDFWQNAPYRFNLYNFRYVYIYDVSGNYRRVDIESTSGGSNSWYRHWSGIDSGGTTNGVVDTTQIDKFVWEWNMNALATNYNKYIFTQYIDMVKATGAFPGQGVTGKIARAVTFNGGTVDSLLLSKTIQYATNTTISAWFNPLSTTGGVIISPPQWAYAYPYQVGLTICSSNNNTDYPNGRYVKFYVRGFVQADILVAPQVSVSNWHYVVASADDTGSFLYVDGVLKVTSTNTIDTSTIANPNNIGSIHIANLDTAGGFNSIIDEVRIVAATRYADWVATEYNNQSDPATFAVPSLERQFPSGTIFRIH